MKLSLFALFTLNSFFGITIHLVAADTKGNLESQIKPPEFYAWSESSEFVRVPKDFLKQISIQSLTVTNFENYRFVLTDEFIRLFRLLPSEVERVTAGVADALHQYRTAQGKHLEPTNEEVNVTLGPLTTPGIVEKLNFRLNPFPEEAAAIHRELEEVLLGILGEERSKYF